MANTSLVWDGCGILVDRDGQHVHTSRHFPYWHGWFRKKWPHALSFPVFKRGEVLFFDSGRYNHVGFRLYLEAPVIRGGW